MMSETITPDMQARMIAAGVPDRHIPPVADSRFNTQADLDPSAFSTQVGGSHYKDFAIQPLEFIVRNNLDFFQGNVVKYVTRYKVKNGLEDLKKARHYIDMMIELMEKNET